MMQKKGYEKVGVSACAYRVPKEYWEGQEGGDHVSKLGSKTIFRGAGSRLQSPSAEIVNRSSVQP